MLIGVAGDWHGNTLWAVSAIKQICMRLPEGEKIILHAGDFGVWAPPGIEKWTFAGVERQRKSFLTSVDDALQENSAELWFVDGNHEDHPMLTELADSDGWITPHIRHLTRGVRWEWHDRVWLACGGAVSVDKNLRTEGINWFPEEEITPAQEAAIIADGRADVLISHDTPTDCRLSLGVPPLEWLKMIPAAEDHRDRLQRICAEVKPSHVFHGHYHQSKIQTLHTVWGKTTFTSLGCDGVQGNWGILDTETMEWEW